MPLLHFFDQIVQDVRYAARGLRQNPGFTAVVTLILALGIGANTAVFSLINGLVLKSLPVEKPQELVRLANPGFSYPIFEQVRERGRDVFSSVFSWAIEDLIVDWSGELEKVQTLVVSDEFYATLGIAAVHGRTFSGEDEVAVLSHNAWERRFGRDPTIIGKTIRVGWLPVSIVGVTPKGFFGVAPGMAPEITLPLRALPKVRPENAGILQQAGRAWLHVIGRLKPGITLAQSNSAFQIFWPQVLEAMPSPNETPARRARFLSRKSQLEPASTGFSRVRNGVFQPLLILSSLVALLLLVACATVANLLLARAGARRQEMAVRLAVGASRGRIMRQLLTEGLVLAGLGGVGGLLAAAWSSTGLMSLLSTPEDPVRMDTVLDGWVLAFTTALSVVTAIVFAVAPAFRASRADIGLALKDDTRVLASGRKRWLGRSLVVVQVGLSMVLVVGAALFARSLNRILSQEAGFQREDLLIVSPDPSSAGYEGTRLVAFYEQLLERLRAQPGVQSASLSQYPPISGEDGSWTGSIGVDGVAPQQGPDNVFFNAVSPGYFRTVGIRLLQGRDFGSQDNQSGTKTVIVNESLARMFFSNQNPVGHHVSVGLAASRQDLEIVGVVADAKYQTLQEAARRIAYLPWLQTADAGNLVVEIRPAASSASVAAAVRAEIRSMDRSVYMSLQTVEDRIRESLVTDRVVAILSNILGGVGLLLASAGLYGLIAYNVNRRTSEIGLRMALGASRHNILLLVMQESLVLAGIGMLLALVASVALGSIVRGVLYGITPTDPVALLASCLIMGVTAFIAGYLPARRASRIDPADALRQQ